jgi:ribosomal protein S30
MGRQGKFAGHGSMTKAGRVRFFKTPKVRKTGVNSKKKKIPRLRYKELYEKRFIREQYGGQPDSIKAKKYRYG